MKRATIALVLVLGAAAVAHLHVTMQRYFPVIRVATPEGLVYTALFDPTAERRACADANRRFLDPVKERCIGCEVVFARCERQLEDLEPAFGGDSIRQHVVSVPGLRIDIDGPAAPAKRSCDLIAGDFARRGLPTASCSSPARVDTRS